MMEDKPTDNLAAPACQADQTGRRCFLGLLLIVCVCLAIRTWVIAHTDVIARDGTVYVKMAREWSAVPSGVIRSYDYHVGYPVALLGVHRLLAPLGLGEDLRSWELAGQTVSLLAAAAATVALWLLAGMTFGWRIAWVTALVFSLGRKWVDLGADVLSDSLAVAFQMWAIVLALATLARLEKRSPWALPLAAATGICAGLGYLVRPEALLAVGLAAVLWLAYRFRGRSTWRLTGGAVVLAVVAALLCVLPYALAIGGLTKKKRLSDFVQGSVPSVWPLAQIGGGDTILAPVQALVACLTEAMHPILFFLALLWLGAWIVRRTTSRKPWGQMLPLPQAQGAFMMVAAAAVELPLLGALQVHVHYLSDRHLLFLAMLLSPLAGAGLLFAAQMVGSLGRSQKTTRAFLLALVPAAVIIGMLAHSLRPLHDGKGWYRQAGERLHVILRDDDYILTDNSWILHYSEGKGESLDVRTLDADGLLRRIREGPQAATYLVLSEEDSAASNRRLQPLLRPPIFNEVPGLNRTGADGAKRVRVFSINRSALENVIGRDHAIHRPPDKPSG